MDYNDKKINPFGASVPKDVKERIPYGTVMQKDQYAGGSYPEDG